MPASKSFCVVPLRRCLGFQQSSVFQGADGIPADFHSMLCGLLFPALVLWALEPGMGLRPLAPQEGGVSAPLQLRYPSGFITTALACKASQFHISAPSTRYSVASSLYP